MSRFTVRDHFMLERPTPRLVVSGDVVEGTVKPGMSLMVICNQTLEIEFEINSVEHVDVKIGTESLVGLVFTHDAEDLDLLQSLNIKGETLEIR